MYSVVSPKLETEKSKKIQLVCTYPNPLYPLKEIETEYCAMFLAEPSMDGIDGYGGWR